MDPAAEVDQEVAAAQLLQTCAIGSSYYMYDVSISYGSCDVTGHTFRAAVVRGDVAALVGRSSLGG